MDQARVSVSSAFHTFMQDQGLLDAAPSFAVALSGGPDSLCLALVAHDWVKTYGGQVVALTVDHGLRSESTQESQQVRTWMESHSIPHQILTWEGEKPTTALQHKGRKARYDLLIKACKEQNIPYLLLGHHQQDQHETFLMRLTSGSGPDGLSCMAPAGIRNGISLLRPFLTLDPAYIKEHLTAQGQEWIEDPSNGKEDFTRIRVRHFLEEEGLSPSLLTQIIANFQDDRTYFDHEVKAWCQAHTTGQPPLYVHIESLRELLSLHPALGKRILRHVIQHVNCYDYGLGPRQLAILWEALLAPHFSAITMGGCYLLKRKSGLHIQRELRAITTRNATGLWDGRIDLSSYQNDTSQSVRPLGEIFVPQLKERVESSIPTVVWPTLPSLWEGDELRSVPHLGIMFKG